MMEIEAVEKIKFTVAAIMLVTEGITDLRKKEIRLGVVAVSALVGIAVSIPCFSSSIVRILLGIAEGGMLILLSFLTGGGIGIGDGLICCACGILLGAKDNFTMFSIAFLICAIFSLVLIVCKKIGRKSTVPFVPFLIPAFLLTVCMRYV